MKKILLLLALLIGISIYSQSEDNYYSEIRLTVDPYVLAKEGNINLKIEASTYFNEVEHLRVNVVLETLTGHDGYYGGSIGAGYSIPYNIGKWKFKIEPGFEIGLISRPNMPTLVVIRHDGSREESNEGYLGVSHSWNLRHQLRIGKSRWSGYIHQRLILRSDLHFEQELTVNPNKLPFYNYDSAIGMAFEL